MLQAKPVMALLELQGRLAQLEQSAQLVIQGLQVHKAFKAQLVHKAI